MAGDWARQDIFTGIFDKVIISVPLKRRSAHTGSFVSLCRAELRVEISLPQQLTSASCFLSPWPPLSLLGQTETDPVLIVVVMLLQWGAVSKSTLNPVLNDHVLQKPDRGECPSQDRSSAPRSASMETQATTKKTVSFSENSSFLQASHSLSESMTNQSASVSSTCKLAVLLSNSHLWGYELLNYFESNSTTGCTCFSFFSSNLALAFLGDCHDLFTSCPSQSISPS